MSARSIVPPDVEDGSFLRVLILSAEMGEGHNAAAQALTEVMKDLWPGTEVERIDTFRIVGSRIASFARWAYSFQLVHLPWTYHLFYEAISHSDRLATWTKKALGCLFGRRLGPELARREVDLIISTYPFGSAALEWLITRRGLRVPTLTYVPAFHVHPLWAYEHIDAHYVMYDSAATDARTSGFVDSVRLGAPPVRRGFGEVSRVDARMQLGLSSQLFVVLVTGGAWGLGNLREGVLALIELAGNVHVVAVCGKNDQLVRQLRTLASERLTVYGYVENMPELMAAADVVVTNGAGVTVLEALQSCRPVVAFSPLVGHGRAATAEMLSRDLALRADTVDALAAAVRALATDEFLLHRMERSVEAWKGARDLRRTVGEFLSVGEGNDRTDPISRPGPQHDHAR